MWFKSAGSMSEMMRAVYVRMYLSLSEVGKTISERVTLADSFLRKDNGAVTSDSRLFKQICKAAGSVCKC